jgi:protein transport protein SEC24
MAPVYPDAQQQQQGLFTPGLSADGQPQYFQQPEVGYPNGVAGAGAPVPYGQPAYGGVAPGGQPPVGVLAEQFAQMGMAGQQPHFPPGGGMAQKPVSISLPSSILSLLWLIFFQFALHTTNLIGTPLDPHDLLLPPPQIRLPPGASISQHPLSNAHHTYMRSTLNAIPTTSSLLNKSKIPFGLVVSPYRSVKTDGTGYADSPEIGEVPVVTDTVIERCRRCRTYINPYVQFIDGGNRWKCCMCNMSNQVPQLFDWDQQTNQPADRWSRLELNHAVVEFVAPTEYMVRLLCFTSTLNHTHTHLIVGPTSPTTVLCILN